MFIPIVDLFRSPTRPRAEVPCIEPLEARIAPAAVAWMKDQDGFWDDATNWSTGHVPVAGDTVTLGAMATPYKVTIRSGAQEVGSLTATSSATLELDPNGSLTVDTASSTHGDLLLKGGNLTVNGVFDAYGTNTWTYNGFNTPITTIAGSAAFNSHGTTNLSGGGETLNTTFNNTGTFHWSTGALTTGTGGLLQNAVGGILDLDGTAQLSQSSLLANAGTLNVTTGLNDFYGTANNTGTVHVLAGATLTFHAAGTSTGAFAVDNTGALAWNDAAYHLGAGATLTGAGAYGIGNFGGVTIDAGASISTSVSLTLDSFANIYGPGNLTLASGGAFLFQGSANLEGVTNGSNPGKLTIAAGATARVMNTVTNDNGYTLEVDGTLTVDGGTLRNHGGSTLIVGGTGTIDLSNGGSVTGLGNGGLIHILSGGEVASVTAGMTGTLAIGGNNDGLLHAAAGTLQLGASLPSTGTYQADANATIVFAASTELLPGANWSGSGAYRIGSGATLTVDAGITLSPTSLEVDGTFAGAGNLEIGNGATATFNLGYLIGTGATHIAAGGTLNGTLLDLEQGRNVTNDGAISVHGIDGNGSSASSVSTITNDVNATFTLLPNANGFADASGRLIVSNAGTLHLDASGAQGAYLDCFLTNTGSVNVTGGFAQYSQSNSLGTPTSSGLFSADAASTLDFYGVPEHFLAGTQFTGAGLFEINTATVFLAGGLNLSPKILELINGEVDGPGSLTAGPGVTWIVSGETLKSLGGFTIDAGATVKTGNNFNNELVLDGTDLTNAGELDLLTNFPVVKLLDGSHFTNQATGVVHMDSVGFQTVNGSTLTITNAGLISADPGSGNNFAIPFGVTFDNSGTFELKSGTASITAQHLAQLSADGTVLTGGTWRALGGSQIQFGSAGMAVTENDADVTLDGSGAAFDVLTNLALNHGRLAVTNGASFTTAAALSNSGRLEIGPSSTVQVTTDFTQSGGGSLLLHIGGTVSSGQFGRLAVTGQATLDGALQLLVDNHASTTLGDVYTPITFGTLNGDFASTNGVAPFFTETHDATGYHFTVEGGLSDLVVTAVTPPMSGSAGQNVTISYTVSNPGGFPTNADHWTDSFYISTSAVFDGTASLLGRVVHQGALAAGGNYSDSLTAALPTVLSGDYHVFVVTDSRNEVAEANNDNNTLASTGTLHVSVPTLTFGTPAAETIAAGQSELFLVHLPTGADHVSLSSAAAGLAEVYLSKGAPPTVSGADFFTYDPANTLQDIVVPEGGNADYYVLVHGREGAGAGTSFTLDAESIPFGITDIGPVAATNNGPVTLAIHGGHFNLGTIFELVKHGTTGIINSTGVSVHDGTLAYVSFDLTGHTATAYDVVAINGASTVSDPSAFQILPAPLADPGVQVILSLSAPSLIRVGRPATLLVTYHNLSGHDVPAPLLVLTSNNADFYDGTERHTQFIEFYGLNEGGGPVQTLPAGYSGSRFFQYLPEVQQAGLVTQLHLAVASTTEALDLGKLDIEARPSGDLTDAQWAQVRAQLVAQLGPTYTQYANVLRGDIPLLPAVLGDDRSPIGLLSIEEQKAEAAVFTSIHGQLGSAPTGVSLAGGLVTADNTDTGEIFTTRSLNDGSFTFGNVTAGSYTFQYDQALVTNATPLTVAGGQHNVPVTLGLAQAGQLSGSLGAATAGSVIALAADGTVFSAAIDGTGHYQFSALPVGAYTLTAEAEGFARAELDNLNVALGANTQNFTLDLEGMLTGHVILHKGGPAGGVATVSAVSLTDANALPYSVPAGADGTYALGGLPAGTYQVTAQEAGYVPAQQAGVIVGSGQSAAVADLTLAVAGSISGVVTGDAAVFTNEHVGAFQDGVAVSSATVGADGKFTIGGLAPGAYVVQPLDHEAFFTSKSVTLAEGKQLTGANITSYAGGGISGTVHLGTTATPFPNATVTAVEPDGTVLTTITDAQGHYAFGGLGIGTYAVEVQAGNSATSGAKVAVATLKSSVIHDLTSNASAHVHGLLSLDGTAPVSGGLVQLIENGAVIASTTTGADGRYSFLVTDAGPFSIQAEADSVSFAPTASFDFSGGLDVTKDVAAGSGSLHVTVTDGSSVSGAAVTLISAATGHTVGAVAVAADGTADFTHLAAGGYYVYVSQSGNRGALVAESIAGATTVNAPVALAAQGTLTGTVKSLPTGSGAQVQAMLAPPAGASAGAKPVLFSVSAAADGTYSLANLPAGSYTVTAVSDGLAAPAQLNGVTVGGGSSGTTDLALTTSGGRLVDGTILSPTGFPIPGATVQFLDANGNLIGTAMANDKGVFTVRLPAGTVHLKIFTQDNAPVDFLGTLQVNLPPEGDPNAEQNLGNLLVNFSNTSDSDAFDPLYATLNALGFGKLTNIFKLYDAVQMEVKGDFMKSPNHVNALPNGTACPGCAPEVQAALFAADKQNTLYKEWEMSYKKLIDDAIQGEADIRSETLQNLNTVIDTASLFFGVGEIVLEAKGAAIATKLGVTAERELLEAAAKKSLVIQTANLVNSCKDFAQGVYDLLQIANNGFQPNDQPNQDVEYVRQVTSAENKVVSLVGTIVSSVQALEPTEKLLLKGGGVITGVLDKLLNYQSTIQALEFNKSQMAAEKVDKDLTKFKERKEPYENAADNAHAKKVALEMCLKNNAANPACNPNPGPGGGGSGPIQPDGPIPQGPPGGSSGQAGSIDPNSIDGPAGFGPSGFVSAQSALPYTIHFENESSATAPAAEVRITEQLNGNLDYNSFQLGDFSFGSFQIAVPSGHSSYHLRDTDTLATLGVYVDFDASVDTHTGLVTWDLKAIDPATGDTPADATKGFLPPNDSVHDGEGAVSYTVSAKSSAVTGATIQASALVYFDANAAIPTSTLSNTLDAVAPSSHVTAPVTAGPDFTVTWADSTDDVGGSGIASYDVYVKDDGLANPHFVPFVLNTTHTAGVFTGVAGHTYEFFSVAQDGAGNREAQPAMADASTAVTAGSSFAVTAGHAQHFIDAGGKSYTVALTGAGSATVTFVNGVDNSAPHADIRAITLTGTTASSALSVTESAGGAVTVGRISSGAFGLGSITLGPGTLLGDGIDDGSADLAIGGALTKLTVADVNTHALLAVGDMLAHPALAKPVAVTLGNVLGDDVKTDFAIKTGAVTVHSWAHAGTLGARQGVAGLTVTTGELEASVSITGNLGPVKIGGVLASPDFEVSGSIGAITSAGFTNAVVKAGGAIGNVVSTASLAGTILQSTGGAIGNLTVNLTKQSGSVTAFAADSIKGVSIGNVTAVVSGTALTTARGIENSLFLAGTGNIGAVTATLSGTGLTDGIALDNSTLIASAGNIGNVMAHITSGSNAATIAAVRATNLIAGKNLGAITAVAVGSTAAAATGRVSGVQDFNSQMEFIATGSVGLLTASATGGLDTVAIDMGNTADNLVRATTSFGGLSLTANKSAAPGAVAYAISRANFFAGTTIGAIGIGGDATTTQVFQVDITAGGSIKSVNVSAKQAVNGTVDSSDILAGQFHPITKAADLIAGALGPVTLSGSLNDSKILATGNLGAIRIGTGAIGNANHDYLVAGVLVGVNGFLTGTDTFYRAASIASLTVASTLSASTVDAGIFAANDLAFGGADALGFATGNLHAGQIGAIQLGGSGSLQAATVTHTNVIEAAVLASVKIGAITTTHFTAPVYLSTGAAESATDELFRLVTT